MKKTFNAFNRPTGKDFVDKKEELKELNRIPKPEETQKEIECGASWQLITNGAIGKLKCRHCGVHVSDGGTPKCLKKEK